MRCTLKLPLPLTVLSESFSWGKHYKLKVVVREVRNSSLYPER